MTEKEAKTKWCPFVRTDAQGPENSACNRYDGHWASNALLCIGSACMAWRWSYAPEQAAGNRNGPQGFCGLAGKP